MAAKSVLIFWRKKFFVVVLFVKKSFFFSCNGVQLFTGTMSFKSVFTQKSIIVVFDRDAFPTTAPCMPGGNIVKPTHFFFKWLYQCINSLLHQHYVIYSTAWSLRHKSLPLLARPWVKQDFFLFVQLLCWVKTSHLAWLALTYKPPKPFQYLTKKFQ